MNNNIVDLKKIKKLRRNKGIDRDTMAKLLGLTSIYSYRNKEVGQRGFNIKELYIIAKLFKMPMEDLLLIDKEEAKLND